eukprot:SM000007S20977  [mRNA]  locus=s7:1355748:1369992:+ [translate_table: standard]
MASKFRRQQRRRRWSGAGTAFPASYADEALAPLLCGSPPAVALAAELARLAGASTTYAEIPQVKLVADAFLRLWATAAAAAGSSEGHTAATRSELQAATHILVELLFLPNSRPLHRGLLAALLKLPPPGLATMVDAFRQCSLDYGTGGHKWRPFGCTAAAATLVCPAYKSHLEEACRACALQLGRSLTLDVAAVLGDAMAGSRLNPAAMDECQESLSVLYYLLQNYLNEFGVRVAPRASTDSAPDAEESGPGDACDQGRENPSNAGKSGQSAPAEDAWSMKPVDVAMVDMLLNVLQHPLLSRDCIVTASGGLCAAIQLDISTEHAAWLFASSVAPSHCIIADSVGGAGLTGQEVQAERSPQCEDDNVHGNNKSPRDADTAPIWQESRFEEALRSLGRCNLVEEIKKLDGFSRLCWLRGLLAAVPRQALNKYLLCTEKEPDLDGLCKVFHASVPFVPDWAGNVSGTHGVASMGSRWHVWTLLYDGILPALCACCQQARDGHFRLHAVTALQQVKTSLLDGVTDTAEEAWQLPDGQVQEAYDPLPQQTVDLLLKIVWNNWEDPLSQTVKQVHMIFDLLMDIHTIKGTSMGTLPVRSGFESEARLSNAVVACGSVDAASAVTFEENADLESSRNSRAGLSEQRSDGDPAQELGSRGCRDENVSSVPFLEQLAKRLLAVGGHRKGRYVPLASVAARLGALKLLDNYPGLLFQTVYAMEDEGVMCAASAFLKVFLEKMRQECWAPKVGQASPFVHGDVRWRRLWMPPMLGAMLLGDSKLRSAVTTYGLAIALQMDGDSLWPMLAFILHRAKQRDGAPCESCGSDQAQEEDGGAWQELAGAPGLPAAASEGQSIAAMVCLLKVARQLGLVDGVLDHLFEQPGESNGGSGEQLLSGRPCAGRPRVPLAMLEAAMSHADDALRLDAAELVCLSPKTASLPSRLELALLRTAVPLNLRCSSTFFRMRWASLMRRLLLRIRTAVHHSGRVDELRIARHPLKSADKQPAGAAYVVSLRGRDLSPDSRKLCNGSPKEAMAFVRWLGRTLLLSLYPSAPYERKIMAMELFKALIQVWAPPCGGCTFHLLPRPDVSKTMLASGVPAADDLAFQSYGEKRLSTFTNSADRSEVDWRVRELEEDLRPYDEGLFNREATAMVLAALVDSWDRLRESTFDILTSYSQPLPGLACPEDVGGVARWAMSLVASPRVRESDAGSLVLRLIFRKYVLGLGWTVRLHPHAQILASEHNSPERCQQCINLHSCSSEVADSASSGKYGKAMVAYLSSLCDWLETGLVEAEVNLVEACKHSLVHGVLLVTRYSIEEIDWTSASVQMMSVDLQAYFQRLLGLLLRVTSLALWVVSADALQLGPSHESDNPEGDAEMNLEDGDASCCLMDGQASMPEADVGDAEQEEDVSELDSEGLAPVEQMIMVGCWLSMKEVSLLLGTIVRRVPLPGSEQEALLHSLRSKGLSKQVRMEAKGKSSVQGLPLLNDAQLEEVGNHFLEVLLALKHNGAIDKTRYGFIAVIERLLRSTSPLVNRLPETWLEKLVRRTAAAGQTADDLLRRSAGIPAAFLAHFLGEPDDGPKRLLPAAMAWLLKVANGKTPEDVLDGFWDVKQGDDFEASDLEQQAGDSTGAIDVKDFIPAVHAFNTLRAAFSDTNLATDTSGFCAQGIMNAIDGFSSSHWQVRNAACLTFTALVHRTLGFLNNVHKETARRAITCFEFFHRYPTLLPFFLRHLKLATLQLKSGMPKLAPSWCPILVLLSRLQPSTTRINSSDWLSPSALIPDVSSLATQKDFHVRLLASRSLVPLVPAKELPSFLHGLAESLPSSGSLKDTENDLASGLYLGDTLLQEKGRSQPSQTTGQQNNRVHGLLLQMQTLLSSSCTVLPQAADRLATVELLLPAVSVRSWLGSLWSCKCPLVVKEYLKMVEGLWALARSCSVAHTMTSEPGIQQDAVIAARQESLCQRVEDFLSSLCRDVLRTRSLGRDAMLVPPRAAAASILCALAVKCNKDSHAVESHVRSFTGLEGQAFIGESSDRPKAAASTTGRSSLAPRLGMTTQHHPEGPAIFENFQSQLSDPMYEVRLATLKVLKSSKCNGARISLFIPMIVDCVSSEDHPSCQRKILQLLFMWSRSHSVVPGQDDNTDENGIWGSCQSAVQLWKMVEAVYVSSGQVKSREAALKCLGACLSRILANNPMAEYTPAILAQWMGMVSRHSHAREPVTFRRATAESIIASGLLHPDHARLPQSVSISAPSDCTLNVEHVTPAADVVRSGQHAVSRDAEDRYRDLHEKTSMQVWLMCIRLLEDEDANVRHSLALAMQEAMVNSTTSSCGESLIPCQVEKVMQQSFEHLAATFGSSPAFVSLLEEWILGSDLSIHNPTYLGRRNLNLVRKLFDKEIDNHHEEILLCVQLACSQLAKIVEALRQGTSKRQVQGLAIEKHQEVTSHAADSRSTAGPDWLWCSRARFSKALLAMSESALELHTRLTWVGGATNHPEIFQPLLRLLLGLCALGAAPDEASTTTSLDRVLDSSTSRNPEVQYLTADKHAALAVDLQQAAELLLSIPLNFILSNVLLRMLRCYEHLLAVPLGSERCELAMGPTRLAIGGTTTTDIDIQRLYELGVPPWAKGEACQRGCFKRETANGPSNHGSDTRGQDLYAIKGIFRWKTSPLLNNLHATVPCEAKGLYTPDQRRNTNNMALDFKGNHKTLAGVSGVDWRKGKVLNGHDKPVRPRSQRTISDAPASMSSNNQLTDYVMLVQHGSEEFRNRRTPDLSRDWLYAK